jgi:hypothetical protein
MDSDEFKQVHAFLQHHNVQYKGNKDVTRCENVSLLSDPAAWHKKYEYLSAPFFKYGSFTQWINPFTGILMLFEWTCGSFEQRVHFLELDNDPEWAKEFAKLRTAHIKKELIEKTWAPDRLSWVLEWNFLSNEPF